MYMFDTKKHELNWWIGLPGNEVYSTSTGGLMLVAHQPPGTSYQRIRETAQVCNHTAMRPGYQRVYLDLEHAGQYEPWASLLG